MADLLQKLGKVTQATAEAFTGVMQSSMKAPRPESDKSQAAAGSGKRPAETEAGAAFTPIQSAALQNGISASITAFAGAVQETVEEVKKELKQDLQECDKKIDLLRKDMGQGFVNETNNMNVLNQKIAQELSGLKQANHDLEKRVKELVETSANYTSELAECKKLATAPRSGIVGQSGVGSNQPHQRPSLPYHERAIAAFGNLGWDTDGATLEERATATFTELGVPADSFLSVTASVGKGKGKGKAKGTGSLVKVQFKTHQGLLLAATKVNQSNKSFREYLGRPVIVWLDAAKDFNELRPGRVMRAVAKVCEHLEEREGRGKAVDVAPKERSVTVDEKVLGYAVLTGWTWIGNTKDRYDQSEIELIEAIAASTP